MKNMTVAVEYWGEGGGGEFQTDVSKIYWLRFQFIVENDDCMLFYYKKVERENNSDQNYMEVAFNGDVRCFRLCICKCLDESRRE